MEDFAVEKSKLKSKFSFLTGIGSSIQPKFYSKPCDIEFSSITRLRFLLLDSQALLIAVWKWNKVLLMQKRVKCFQSNKASDKVKTQNEKNEQKEEKLHGREKFDEQNKRCTII
ncbi:hypothetical protein IC575_002165 [Cucumis melo]